MSVIQDNFNITGQRAPSIWDSITYEGTPFEGLINKLKISDTTTFAGAPAAIINLFMPYVFVAAGFILFIRLMMASWQMITAMGDDGKLASAKKTITNTLIGFIILFTSYWLIQIIEILLRVEILNPSF